MGLPPARNAPAADVAAPLEIGHRLMDAGEYELALRSYYRAAADLGFTVDVLSAIGSANLRLERLGQAERILRAALDMDETFIPALNNLGVVLNAKNEIGEARELFRTAFALDSGQS
ncbi:MAG: tetratricopeptide repeat protein, partial [Pseudomonadota bacterium]